jgi:hypothetical protein
MLTAATHPRGVLSGSAAGSSMRRLDWRTAAAALLLFTGGVLVGHRVLPALYRVEWVMVIHGKPGQGCSGGSGAGVVLLGRPRGNSDGEYRIGCGERMRVDETAQLHCSCSR